MIVAVCTAVWVLTVIALVWKQARDYRADGLIREKLRHRFLVTLKTGDAFDGLLIDVDGRTVVLRDARQVTGDGSVPVDGELLLMREDIAYLQRPT